MEKTDRLPDTPTTFPSIVNQSIRSPIHASQQPNLSYRFPIFETSATALCGTIGIESMFPPFDMSGLDGRLGTTAYICT